MKDFKLELLNNEESNQIRGGAPATCNKAGDTIQCNLVANMKACVSYEVRCTGNFASSCTKSSITITGCSPITFS